MLSPLFLFLGQGTFSTSLSLFLSIFLSLSLWVMERWRSWRICKCFKSSLPFIHDFHESLNDAHCFLGNWNMADFRQCCQAAFLHSSNGKTFFTSLIKLFLTRLAEFFKALSCWLSLLPSMRCWWTHLAEELVEVGDVGRCHRWAVAKAPTATATAIFSFGALFLLRRWLWAVKSPFVCQVLLAVITKEFLPSFSGLQ